MVRLIATDPDGATLPPDGEVESAHRRVRLIVETQRLRLREVTPADLDGVAALVADGEQMRFYPRVRTRDEALAWIERASSVYERCGFGFWGVETLARGRFVGYCGIRPLTIDGAVETEMGWHIDKAFWNQGLATEAALAARDVAFARFRLTRLVAMIHPDNVASCRVAAKIGMYREKSTVFDGDPYVIYVAERPQA